jgi:hypothetical protein
MKTELAGSAARNFGATVKTKFLAADPDSSVFIGGRNGRFAQDSEESSSAAHCVRLKPEGLLMEKFGEDTVYVGRLERQ